MSLCCNKLHLTKRKTMQPYLRYSPNHNERPAEPVSLIVLHYTGMTSGQEALAWMCNAASKVSAHYMVEENGEIVQMVEEDRRAWHAGISHWAGRDGLNDISIGIEIVNKGHEHGYTPFPDVQIAAVLRLAQDIMHRHELPAHSVVAHSDIAPLRKQDPGELFPWGYCADQGVGIWHHDNSRAGRQELLAVDDAVIEQLRSFGYGINQDDKAQQSAVITAFQRRFRTELMNGLWDRECQRKLTLML
jgi:N-acetylmuramoyl-L-alanine amidase